MIESIAGHDIVLMGGGAIMMATPCCFLDKGV